MAQAADAMLTLACQGTVTTGAQPDKPELVSMGIIVNFTNGTVQGFNAPVKIRLERRYRSGLVLKRLRSQHRAPRAA
jgi:hypothetical protein